MKLIIDIEESDLYAIKTNQYYGKELEKIIANGTPYNPTGDLISRSALKAELDDYIDDSLLEIADVKELINNAQVVEAYPFEQVRELIELNLQFAQEIENVKRPKSEWKETTHLWETNLSGGMGYDWGYYYACPICSLEVSEKTDFCPQCGADMRDGAE